MKQKPQHPTGEIRIGATSVEVYDGWVSVRDVVKASGLPAQERQREKIAARFTTIRKRMPTKNRWYLKVCMKEVDAQAFVEAGGIWVVGPYKKPKND